MPCSNGCHEYNKRPKKGVSHRVHLFRQTHTSVTFSQLVQINPQTKVSQSKPIDKSINMGVAQGEYIQTIPTAFMITLGKQNESYHNSDTTSHTNTHFNIIISDLIDITNKEAYTLSNYSDYGSK